MRVPLLDVGAQLAPLRAEIDQAVARVIDSGHFILGPEVDSLERELSIALHTAYVVGVSSGTDALLVALMALGIGPGDDVVTTPFSFFATAGVVSRLGARPVFADIEPRSFNLDPHAAASAFTTKTRAVIPVHLFGRPATLPKVTVPIVEDAAQSIGASRVTGICACLSFFPSKNLGAFGDAGAVISNDERFIDRVRLMRTHGSRPKYIHHVVGGNFRIDALQAAILRVKLPHLATWTQLRRRNAARYREMFAANPHIPAELQLPEDSPDHIYNQFVIRAPRRDGLREFLGGQRIGTEVYYPMPFHTQPCFRDLGHKEGAFPHAERACREVLAIPIYPELTEEQQAWVVDRIGAFYAG
jgi:dTDP-4-amino-4,6-dideoxygalactose transaminase